MCKCTKEHKNTRRLESKQKRCIKLKVRNSLTMVSLGTCGQHHVTGFFFPMRKMLGFATNHHRGKDYSDKTLSEPLARLCRESVTTALESTNPFLLDFYFFMLLHSFSQSPAVSCPFAMLHLTSPEVCCLHISMWIALLLFLLTPSVPGVCGY